MSTDHKAQFFYGFQVTAGVPGDFPKGLNETSVGNDSDNDIFVIVEDSEWEAQNYESIFVGENPQMSLPTESVLTLKKFRDELLERNEQIVLGEIGWYLGLWW